MEYQLQEVLPAEIEKKSMEIIARELVGKPIDPENEPVIKRVIHTTADFDYAENLAFSPGVVQKGVEAVNGGACIVTDTQMAKAGVNKKVLASFGGEVFCFMSDEDVAQAARREGTTRAVQSMEKACGIRRPLIFAIGNAPTALVKLCELIDEKRVEPKLVIGAPVGFVNVVESKELLLAHAEIPQIVARGRKGGSGVAAAICNAILYAASGRIL